MAQNAPMLRVLQIQQVELDGRDRIEDIVVTQSRLDCVDSVDWQHLQQLIG
jgi:hypothetical protein